MPVFVKPGARAAMFLAVFGTGLPLRARPPGRCLALLTDGAWRTTTATPVPWLATGRHVSAFIAKFQRNSRQSDIILRGEVMGHFQAGNQSANKAVPFASGLSAPASIRLSATSLRYLMVINKRASVCDLE